MKASLVDQLERINCDKVATRSICISQPKSDILKIGYAFGPFERDTLDHGYFIEGRTCLLRLLKKNNFQTLPFFSRGEDFIHLPRFIKHLAGSHTL